ncbi:MAG: response regulator [Thermomicrobiales bacterium]
MTDGRITVLIVDDHPVVRTGLQGMLAGQPDFAIVGEAVDGAEAVTVATRLRPAVVLMDLRMPGLDGVAATARITSDLPGTRVVVLTTYDSDADILRAIEAGATGYLLKDSPRDDLYRAIRAAAEGKPLLAPSVTTRLMARMRAPADESLSDREVEVLRRVARGGSNREIARDLAISEATVKSHLIHIFRKLDVADRTAAVTVALERGFLQID